ncbi:MAG TPA: ABC transporter permease [Clostridiales bacterium]|nr:ABC transporter permease [Clostridiales bacterium]
MAKRISPQEKSFQIITGTIYALFALICFVPFYYIFIISISDNHQVSTGHILLYPIGIHITNYINVFKLRGFPDATLISVSRSVLGTVLNVVTSAFLGYAFTKREMWHRAFWYRYLMIIMYFSAGLIPVYLNYRNLHLTNTFWIYIVGFISPFNIILCKTFIESLPLSLEESAKLDGAGYVKVFRHIIFPLSKPIVATIAVFTAVGHWNSYIDTLLYVQNSKLYTLQFVLYNYLQSAQALANIMKESASAYTGTEMTYLVSATSVKMTVTIVVTLPVLFVYPFFQRFFVKGLILGAIKG